MRVKVVAIAAALLAAPYGVAFGVSINTFNQIVTFGDSLSDPGNISYAAQQLGAGSLVPGPGYATRTVGSNTVGYYTNPQSGSGPSGLWIDQLAAKMGLADPAPAYIPGSGGTNFALAGSETGTGNSNIVPLYTIPSMQTEVSNYLTATSGHASSTALYTFWGGANDLHYGGATPTQAANNIMSQIQQVAADGGKYFLWVDLPPLGDVPEAGSNAALLNAGSALFDQQYAADVAALNASGITVIGVDVSSLFQELVASPGTFGLTDVTDACNTTAGCNPNTFLFWDGEHPTTEVDSYVAAVAYNDLVGVPEPASFALLFMGGFGLLALSRARRKAARSANN